MPDANAERISVALVEDDDGARERFERVGVRKLRTMLANDNPLILSFFRSQGLRAGRLIPLELEIGTADGTEAGAR